MPSKLNQLSIAANTAESFAVVKSAARSAELAAQEEELSSDVLQVAARLRASLTEERVLVVTGLAPDDRAHSLRQAPCHRTRPTFGRAVRSLMPTLNRHS